MKKLILTFALVVVSQLGFSQAVDEAFKKDIMRVIENSEFGGQIKMVRDQITKQIPAEKQAAFLIEFDATMPALQEKLATVYMETYTKEDVKAMLAFYDSPVGKKIAEKSADLATKSQAAGQEWGQGLQAMMMKYMQ